MKNKIKVIPKFKNEDEEILFWDKHSFVDYVDIKKAIVNPTFPNLKFSTKSISMRFPRSLVDDLKFIANKKDVPYQSLIKIYLAEIVKKELYS
jgi:predicted DNA binding CopG/RHH family protein